MFNIRLFSLLSSVLSSIHGLKLCTGCFCAVNTGYATIHTPNKLIFVTQIIMEKRLTKAQLMSAMAEAWGVSKKEATDHYDALLNLIYGEVNRSGEIMLPGLGKFAKKHRAARKGRNPMTGAEIQIPAKTVLKFSVNKAAKDALL